MADKTERTEIKAKAGISLFPPLPPVQIVLIGVPIGLTRRREAREDEQAAIQPNVEGLSTVVVDAAFHLHRDLGPGLLESVYEAIRISILQFVLPGPLVLLLR